MRSVESITPAGAPVKLLTFSKHKALTELLAKSGRARVSWRGRQIRRNARVYADLEKLIEDGYIERIGPDRYVPTEKGQAVYAEYKESQEREEAERQARPPAADKPMTLHELQLVVIINEHSGQPLPIERARDMTYTGNPLRPDYSRRMTQYALKSLREKGWIERQMRLNFTGPPPPCQPGLNPWRTRNAPNRYTIAPLRKISRGETDRGMWLPKFYSPLSLRGAMGGLLLLAGRSAARMGGHFSRFFCLVLKLIRRLGAPIEAVRGAWVEFLALPNISQDRAGRPIRDPPAYLYACLEQAVLEKEGIQCRFCY